jgi:hypothetical protein
MRGEEAQIADPVVARTACFGLMPTKACGRGPITDLPVQPRLQKYFGFLPTQITGLLALSRPKRGAFRDRHGRWSGMQWTRGGAKDERAYLADGEVVWSCSPVLFSLAKEAVKYLKTKGFADIG